MTWEYIRGSFEDRIFSDNNLLHKVGQSTEGGQCGMFWRGSKTVYR